MIKKLKILSFTVGALLFAFLIYNIGVGNIYDNLLLMGYKFPLIFLPFCLIFLLDTLGWQYSFNNWSKGIKLKILYPVRWAGEAINILTPTAYVGGEPVKAYILKKYNDIPLNDGLASVVVSKTIMTMAQIVFLIAGIILATHYIVSSNYLILTVTISILMSIVFLYFLFHWQKRGLFTSIATLLEKFTIKVDYIVKNREKIETLDKTIRFFYEKKKKRFYISFGYYLLAWTAGMFEVYIILYLMGYKISFFEALVIESLVQLLKSCSFFIPGSLGVLEGGGALVFTSLGHSMQMGLTYGIFRRLRELIWAGIGLIILTTYGVGRCKDLDKNISTET